MHKVGHIWLFANLTLLKGFPKFFKLKNGDMLQEVDHIIRLEFYECEATMLSWKHYNNGEGG